jgi:putative transposase
MRQKAQLDKKPWNHKRLYRVYCELGLNLRIKPRKRLAKGEARALVYPIKPNVCWSMDFMTDVLETGQRFRTLNVIDDFNREGLLVKAKYSYPSKLVIHSLDKLIASRGKPRHIRVDNGPEFSSVEFKTWAKNKGIELLFIQPGKPAQNGLIERFNRTYREDILDMHLFSSLTEVKQLTEQWLKRYNQERPHQSLNGLTPVLFAKKKVLIAA